MTKFKPRLDFVYGYYTTKFFLAKETSSWKSFWPYFKEREYDSSMYIKYAYIKSPPWVIPFHFNYIPREKNQNLMFYSLYFTSHTIPRSNAISIISSLLVFFSATEYILLMMFINTFIQSKLPLPALRGKKNERQKNMQRR